MCIKAILVSMLEEELSRLNRMGLIAGPGESAEEFQKRVDYCLSLKQTLPKEFTKEVPFAAEDTDLSRSALEESFELTKKLYDINPGWVPCFFSNYQLAPWHGGCAWIFQKDDDTPMGAFLQLRKALHRKTSYLGIYKRKELVGHELCHVGRMMFDEPEFEEMLAYRTASSGFQKTFSSLVRSSIEAMIFLLTVFMIAAVDIMAAASGFGHFLMPLLWLIPLGMIAYALLRLWRSRKTFERCLQNLGKTRQPNAVIYRLTDEEIARFSKMPAEEIAAFAEKKQGEELRWKQIYPYFRLC